MATKLNNASTNAAKKVADKITGKQTKTTQTATLATAQETRINPTGNVAVESIKVPGLFTINPDTITGMIPTFNPDEYQISNPLKPGTLPQITQQEYDQGITIYEGAQRALKLTGAALDTTRERFAVIGKHAQMVGQGIKTATETEKVKGSYIDYLTQLETNKQKGVALDVATVKTATDTDISTHTKVEMTERLKQAEASAALAKAKSAEVLGKLDEFKKQLGQYLPQQLN